MEAQEVKLYPTRWRVLALFMFVNIMVQVLWICYAPIATVAAAAFKVPRDNVDMLANLFMLIYLPVSIPASWAIDTFGFKKAVSFGALLMGVFGLLRGLFPTSYAAALIGTIGISIGQPFLMNAFTKFAADWFPKKERATITGVVFLAVFVGIGLGEALSPGLVSAFGFGNAMLAYGIIAAVSAALFLLFVPLAPPTPASPPGEEVRALVFDGLKLILKEKSTYFLALALLLGSGIVNGIFTLIDGLGEEKGLSVQQRVLLTTLLLVGGVVGSVVVPLISDLIKRRKIIIQAAVFLAIPSTVGIILGQGFAVQALCFFAMGLFVTGVTPLAYQYGSEITHPAPEGTSNGIFALVVQASGLLIVAMDALKGLFHGSYLPSFAGLAILLFLTGILMSFMRESYGRKG